MSLLGGGAICSSRTIGPVCGSCQYTGVTLSALTWMDCHSIIKKTRLTSGQSRLLPTTSRFLSEAETFALVREELVASLRTKEVHVESTEVTQQNLQPDHMNVSFDDLVVDDRGIH